MLIELKSLSLCMKKNTVITYLTNVNMPFEKLRAKVPQFMLIRGNSGFLI